LAAGESTYSLPLLSLLSLDAEKDKEEKFVLIGGGQSLIVGMCSPWAWPK